MKRSGFRKATYDEAILAAKAKIGKPLYGMEMYITPLKRKRKTRVAGKSEPSEKK